MEGLNLFDEFNGFAGMFGAYIVFPGLTIFFGVLAFGPTKAVSLDLNVQHIS